MEDLTLKRNVLHCCVKKKAKRKHNMETVAVRTSAPYTGESGLLQNMSTTPHDRCAPTGGEWKTAAILISLTVHACVLCFLVCRSWLGHLVQISPFLSGQLRQGLIALHKKSCWMLPKLLTEQLVTWTLIVMAGVDIAQGELITYPFVTKVGQDKTLTGAIFCVNIGKYIYKSVQDIMLARHLTNFKVDILHHSVTLCCYAVFLINGENLLLGLVGIMVESDLICNDIIRVQKQICCDKNSKSYKRLVSLSACWTAVSRGLVPAVFLIIALIHQEVMAMQFVSVIFWFLGLVFFLAINIWLIFRTGMRMRKAFLGHPLPVNIGDLDETPPVLEQWQHMETTPVPVTRQIPTFSVPERAIPLQFKNDLSYLSPFSNVNINIGDRDSKLNFSNKKVISKDTVNNIAVLFKTNKLRIANHRGRGIPGTSSQYVPAHTNRSENNRTSVISESAVQTRVDESRGGIPRVVISDSDHAHQSRVHRRAETPVPCPPSPTI